MAHLPKAPLLIARALLGLLVLPDAKNSFAQECSLELLFGPPVSLGGSIGTEIEVGDFNGDDILDLALAAPFAVFVRLGQGSNGVGDGTFGPPVGYPLHPSAPTTGMTLFDFNNDTRLDLCIASGAHLTILLGEPDGTFAPSGTDVSAGEGDIAVADFNGDQIADVAVEASNGIQIAIGGGTSGVWDGTFQPGANINPWFTNRENGAGLVAGHFDQDSFVDIVHCNIDLGRYAVLRGAGDGTFTFVQYFLPGKPTSINKGDFDSDGIPDIAFSLLDTATGLQTGATILLGAGDGTFSPGIFYPDPGASHSGPFRELPVADFDNDGILDVAIPNDSTENVSVFLGQGVGGIGNGTLAPPLRFHVGSPIVAGKGADFNEDGRLDLAVGPDISVLFGRCATPVDAAPEIADIRDVPNDQGGRLFVTWLPSVLDNPDDSAITGYTVWRRIPPAMAKPIGRIRERPLAGSPTFWEALDTVPAHFLEGYGFTAPTTQDSMPGSNPFTAFFVSAITEDPFVFFDSAVDSGYSVDNLAPFMPTGFMGEQVAGDLEMHWNPNPDADLSHYALYRGPDVFFEPGESNRIASLSDTSFVDTQFIHPSAYKLSAIDIHGNEGPFALFEPESPVAVVVSDLVGTASESGVQLSWRLSDDALREVSQVEIQRGTSANRLWATIGRLTPATLMQFEDPEITLGSTYWYRLSLRAIDGATRLSAPIEVSTSGLRLRTALHAPRTALAGPIEIRYTIGVPSKLRLEVFDVAGRRVRTLVNGDRIPGEYRQPWDRADSSGTRVANGIYIVRLSTGDVAVSRKVAVLR